MRKARKWGIFALSALCAFSFGAAAALAEGGEGTKVDLPDAGNILQWATSYQWVPEGLKAVKDADRGGGGAGFVRQFDVSGEKQISLTFKIPVYSVSEDDGTNSAPLADKEEHEVDLVLTNKNNGKSLRFRIWVNSGKGKSAVSTSVAIIDEADNWKSYELDGQIAGTARENSSFTVGYSAGRLMMVKSGQTQLSEIAGKDEAATAALHTMLDAKFAGCDTLQLHFSQPAIAEGKNSVMIFTDISGQSLANDGKEILDNVAPEVPAVKVSDGAQIVAGKSYSLYSMSWWSADVKGAEFYVDPIFDVIGGNALQRKLTAVKDGQTVELFSYGDDKDLYTGAISFPSAGKWSLTLSATDPAGNTGVSQATEVTVLDRIVVTVPDYKKQGEIAQPFTLPKASATFQGQNYDVAVAVTDPAGNPVTVQDDSFTPAEEGRYRVAFSAAVTGDAANYDEVVQYVTIFDPAKPKVRPEPGNILQWAASCEFVDDGLEAVTGQWGGPGLRMFFDVTEGKEFNIKFKIPVYDATGGWLDEKFKQPIVDVFIKDAVSGNMAVLRLYGDTYNAATGTIKVRITLGDKHDVEQDGKDPDVFFPAEAYGRMDENQEFTVAFNTRDFFRYVQQKDGQPEKAAFADEGKNADYISRMGGFFRDTTSVQVWLRLSTYVEADKESTKNRVVITEINGQSLANVGGLIADTQAPYVAPLEQVKDRTLEINKDYLIEVKGAPSEAVKQKDAVIFAPFVSDVLGNEKLTYRIKLTKNGKDTLLDGLSFRLDAVGEYKITLIAEDEMGLIGQAEIDVSAVKGYDIQLDGEVPATGRTGERVQLPAATASDSDNNPQNVTVTVEDMNGKKIELDENNGFIPAKSGVYYVTYFSSYIDANQQTRSAKLEKEIVVSGDPYVPEQPTGLTPGAIAGIVCGCVGGAALIGIAVWVILRRRRK